MAEVNGGWIDGKKSDQARPYATNLLVVKEHCDPETGIQRPDEEDIEQAKACVDANEK